MSNYIKREDALKALCEDCAYKIEECNETFRCEESQIILDVPAADVVEVVRCKDCKNAIFVVYGADACACSMIDILVCRDKYFFCAYGERRADNA